MKALQTGIANQRWDLAAHALVIGLLKAETGRRHAGRANYHRWAPCQGDQPVAPTEMGRRERPR